MGATDQGPFLDALRAFTSDTNRLEFTRPNLIALLDLLTDHLGGQLAIEQGVLEDGTHVEVEHPVVAQLTGLALALRDLDKGLTDPVLKRVGGKKNAARPWRLMKDDDVLFDTLEIFQQVRNLPNRKAAAKAMALKLRTSGYKRRGNWLSWGNLYALYHKYRL
jgi:hypothetical protein